ncbi:MAG: hypothetical protein Q4D65_09125 [Peptostreptococcaceae bacterium]|nr:hypothetical protein [Peptostreptococcaceae bacterium]
MGMLLRRHHGGDEAEQSADLPLEVAESDTETTTKNIESEDVVDETKTSEEEEAQPGKKTGKKTIVRKSGKKATEKE